MRRSTSWSTSLWAAVFLSISASVFFDGCTSADDRPGAATVVSSASPPSRDEASRDGETSEPWAPDGAPPPIEISPGPPEVQLIGRIDTRDAAGPRFAWPGGRIVARFSGTAVSVRLRELDDDWMLGAPSEWDVAIDGAWQPKLVMLPNQTKDYALASGLAPGAHVVELYKRSEAQNGSTQFLGFDFKGGELLSPPVRKTRRIEIIGDSAPAGFGVEGVGRGPDCPGDDWAATWQNFRLSLGARLGERFAAEVAGTVYSGKGMAKNIWPADRETMPQVFLRANPIDPSSTWDFSGPASDVVVIMMGGNDFAIGQPVDEGPATLAQFTDAYDGFVVAIRQRYPAAHVFLITSPSVSDALPPGRLSRTNVAAGIAEVLTRRTGAGDDHVYGFAPTLATPAELTGCNGHGSPEFHQRVANELAVPIREKTGW